MSITITLTHSVKTTEEGTTKLHLVTEGVNITSKVFACEVVPPNASSDTTARFSHICSPMELVEFPEDNPGQNSYFRVDEIECVFDTATLAYKMLDHTSKDITHLVTELNTLEAIGETYGTGSALDTAAVLTAAPELQFSEDGETWHADQTEYDSYIRFRNSALAGDWSKAVLMPFLPVRKTVSDTGTTYTLYETPAGYDYKLGELTSLVIASPVTGGTDTTITFKAGTGFTAQLPLGAGIIGETTYTAGERYMLVLRNSTVEIKHIA